jgi:hypothetical protein
LAVLALGAGRASNFARVLAGMTARAIADVRRRRGVLAAKRKKRSFRDGVPGQVKIDPNPRVRSSVLGTQVRPSPKSTW